MATNISTICRRRATGAVEKIRRAGGNVENAAGVLVLLSQFFLLVRAAKFA
jgi:hypothetical protein